MEDAILWPHVSILHMIASALPMHVLVPDEDSYTPNVPHGFLTSNQYWRIHNQAAPAHGPRALGTGIPTFAFFDWGNPILPTYVPTKGSVCKQSDVGHGEWVFEI